MKFTGLTSGLPAPRLGSDAIVLKRKRHALLDSPQTVMIKLRQRVGGIDVGVGLGIRTEAVVLNSFLELVGLVGVTQCRAGPAMGVNDGQFVCVSGWIDFATQFRGLHLIHGQMSGGFIISESRLAGSKQTIVRGRRGRMKRRSCGVILLRSLGIGRLQRIFGWDLLLCEYLAPIDHNHLRPRFRPRVGVGLLPMGTLRGLVLAHSRPLVFGNLLRRGRDPQGPVQHKLILLVMVAHACGILGSISHSQSRLDRPTHGSRMPKNERPR